MIWSVFVVCFHEVLEKRKAILIRPDIINIAKRNLYRKKSLRQEFCHIAYNCIFKIHCTL